MGVRQVATRDSQGAGSRARAAGAIPTRLGAPQRSLCRARRSELSAVLALQRSAGNQATGAVLRALERAPDLRGGRSDGPRHALPNVRIEQRRYNDILDVHWFLEFESPVTRSELAKALFRDGHPPDGWALDPEPTAGAATGSTAWSVTCFGPTQPWVGQLTDYALELRQRAQSGELTSTTRGRWDAAEDARAKRAEAEDNRYDARLNMTMAQARRTLQPGVYLSAPGKPMFPVPELIWRDGKAPDLRWLKDYEDNGVVVEVWASLINISPLPSGAGHELRLADDFWFLQHGAPTFAMAEINYAVLQDELNMMMIKALIGVYAGAGGVSFAPGAASGESLLIGGIQMGSQGYGLYKTWEGLYKDWVKRTEADEARSQAKLELKVLIDERAALGAATSATHEPSVSPTQVQRAPPGRTTTRLAPMRERTDGFVRDLAAVYKDSIVEVRLGAGKSGITHQQLGKVAEEVALRRVESEGLARKWQLDPNRIFLGDSYVGVGAYSAEAKSRYYKFLVELKLSPDAIRPDQLEAHLVALSEGFDFPEGGRHVLITGERFRGSGITVTDVNPGERMDKILERFRASRSK
jgi:hypothetical protein